MASARTRMQLRLLAVVVAAASTMGVLFNLATVEISLDSVLQGVVDGSLIGLCVGGYIFFVRDGPLRNWLARWNFALNLAFNSAAALSLFLLARSVGVTITSGRIETLVTSLADPHLLLATPFFAVCTVALMFVVQMNRMIGHNVLGYFLAGAYHRPVEEERIFLFVDLVGSTRMAETLGSAPYYGLLRRFVDDLTEPILASGGEIYQYAGDQVIISWRSERGLRDGSCLRCFFGIQDAIAGNAASYERDFGEVPRFRGGLHGGQVTAGELGDLKQEIVFVGDVLNTGSRLEDFARHEQLDFVVSEAIVATIDLPPGCRADFLEELQPRGKERAVRVYHVYREAGAQGPAAVG